jgi:hypothetical protein
MYRHEHRYRNRDAAARGALHVLREHQTARRLAVAGDPGTPRGEADPVATDRRPVVTRIASLTPESVTRFLVGGFMEVLRSWMEDPDSTDLRGRVSAALDTVNALLGLTTHSKGPQHG